MVKASSLETAKINWKPAWRIISTKFVSKNLCDDIANEEDFDCLNQLDELTKKRSKEKFPAEEGSSFIRAPFAYRKPGRFNDATFGALYAAKTYETAIAETKYHREKFMSYTKEKPQMLELRVLNMNIKGEFHDVRNIGFRAKIYDKENYHVSQKLGSELRENDSNGVVYNSVRHSGGECIGVYKQELIKHCKHLKYIGYFWDGNKILYHSDDINIL